MHSAFVSASARSKAIPVHLLDKSAWREGPAALAATQRRWLETTGFAAAEGELALLPSAGGDLGAVALGLGEVASRADPFLCGKLPGALPKGVYAFAEAPPRVELACLAWALGSYRFGRYRKTSAPEVRLKLPRGVDGAHVSRIADAVGLARDLINTPANDMGPAELEAATRTLARTHKARVTVVTGQQLITRNFPMIHAVGRASDKPPRLIDLTWGNARHPKVTLVGKGVCFDTGGLDIKPSSAMLLMKKDMGGAANVLGLAAMIMGAKLPVRLRVLIPAVENAISGNAFRPGDILPSRKGLTVEIGNTDAEGRLVLADALALADDEAPDLLIDMATLTGAARVALGPELPPFYTDDDALAAEFEAHARAENDPLWRMPFWAPYDKLLESRIADVNHVSSGPHAGSITAALFLKRFVARARAYIHLDIFAWTPSARPGRPEGGEAQAIRALYALISARYGR